MLNIVIPLGAQSNFFESGEHAFPKPLVEIDGKPMIQHVIENLATIREEKRFVFILRAEDCTKYHLDSTVRLLAGDGSVIIQLFKATRGAACSVMLAIDQIGNEQPLLVANGDQIFDDDLNMHLAALRALEAEAGCLTFDSVHPRWSYVRMEGSDDIVETAEKHPISRSAIAGFYYFARGADFIEAAQRSIRKDASVDGAFYVAPVLNELILMNRRVKAVRLREGTYHTFYTPRKIEEYESRERRQRGGE